MSDSNPLPKEPPARSMVHAATESALPETLLKDSGRKSSSHRRTSKQTAELVATMLPEEPAPPPPDPLTEEEQKKIGVLYKFFYPIIARSRNTKNQKRVNIVRELIQTERNYVNNLNILMEVYYKPLDMSLTTKKPLIDSASLRELFGNCDEIRDAHQEGILNIMEQEIMPALQTGGTFIYTRLSSCFVSLLPHLQRLYTVYLSTKEHSDELLQRLNKQKPFREFLAKALFNPASKCQEIEDLLILPTHRMGGYKLLLERLLRYCAVGGFEEAQKAIQIVLQSIISVGQSMNSNTSDSSNQEKLLNIAETVSQMPPFLVLMKPGRKVYGDFKCHKYDSKTGEKGQMVIGYILSDMILLATVSKSRFGAQKVVYMDAFPYTQIKIMPSELSVHADRSMILKTDTQEYYLRMMKSKAKKEFARLIKSTKKKIATDVEKQSSEGKEYILSMLNELTDMYMKERQPRLREDAIASLI